MRVVWVVPHISTGDDRPHTEHFKNTRQWASFTPMDLLMFKWLRTGWEPRHVHDRNGTVRIERADTPRGRSKYYKNQIQIDSVLTRC